MVHFTESDQVDNKASAIIIAGLDTESEKRGVPVYKSVPLQILVHDDRGNLIGGLEGKTFWNWLYIDLLWVDVSNRNKNIGAQLVKQAEKMAIKRDCVGSYLWTESFQAPNFYLKLGYEKFVVKQDFPVGHQRIGFMKRLAT